MGETCHCNILGMSLLKSIILWCTSTTLLYCHLQGVRGRVLWGMFWVWLDAQYSLHTHTCMHTGMYGLAHTYTCGGMTVYVQDYARYNLTRKILDKNINR